MSANFAPGRRKRENGDLRAPSDMCAFVKPPGISIASQLLGAMPRQSWFDRGGEPFARFATVAGNMAVAGITGVKWSWPKETPSGS